MAINHFQNSISYLGIGFGEVSVGI